MIFEWDEQKRLINLQRHGIDFADVWRVFEYETATEPDERFDYGEARLVTLGLLFGVAIIIIHTETEETIRIKHQCKMENGKCQKTPKLL